MDYFDLAASSGGLLANAFTAARQVRFCVLSFTSDWLYPTVESRSIVRALNAAGARASFVEIDSDKGHDAFLLDEPVMYGALSGFPRRGRPGARAGVTAIREDFREILRLVRPGSRVLDIGCGEGALLELLARENGVDGRGLDVSPLSVSACLARGLAVVQGDADRDLADFPAQAFDYAILSQTLQQVREPKTVLTELLRIADKAIVLPAEFRPLAGSAASAGRRADAGDRMPAGTLVVDAEHPPVHPARLHRSVRRAWRAHRRRLRPWPTAMPPPDRPVADRSRTGAPNRRSFCSAGPEGRLDQNRNRATARASYC